MPKLAKTKTGKPALVIGYLLIFSSLILVLKLFFEPLKLETNYNLISAGIVSPPVLTPVNTDFSLLVSKIGAAAPIVASVDPYDSWEYQNALTRGIAHAEGTGFPGEGKNIFLFAHSSANPLEASRFNSVFYLLHRLESGDEIEVWYQDTKHLYGVTEKKFVNADNVEYLTNSSQKEQLVLMTCWPPGTTLKRLLIVAKPLTD